MLNIEEKSSHILSSVTWFLTFFCQAAWFLVFNSVEMNLPSILLLCWQLNVGWFSFLLSLFCQNNYDYCRLILIVWIYFVCQKYLVRSWRERKKAATIQWEALKHAPCGKLGTPLDLNVKTKWLEFNLNMEEDDWKYKSIKQV